MKTYTIHSHSFIVGVIELVPCIAKVKVIYEIDSSDRIDSSVLMECIDTFNRKKNFMADKVIK